MEIMTITWFEKIKFYYDEGAWTKEMVGQAVVMGKITPEEYETIVGEPYTPPE